MSNVSFVFVEGRLAHDPVLRTTSNGKSVLDLTLAVNHDYKDKDGNEAVSFFDITIWEKQAELCAEYLIKGQMITLNGQLRQERWENENGERRSRVRVVANQVRFGPKPARLREVESEDSDELSEKAA